MLVCGDSLEILESCQGVIAAGLRGAGVLHLVSEPTFAVTRACASQGRGHVARRGTFAGTGRMDVCQEGTFLAWG